MNKQILGAIMTTLVAGTLSSTAMADKHEKSDAKANGKDANKSAATKAIKADHAAVVADAAGFWCLNQTCKGHSDCAGNGNASCHGKNECKGKGILEVKDEAACKTAGGLWATKK
jgi:hypothetical protein